MSFGDQPALGSHPCVALSSVWLLPVYSVSSKREGASVALGPPMPGVLEGRDLSVALYAFR